jgi:hypothetical protein
LQGDVSLDDYSKALTALAQLVHALEAQVAGGGKIDWIVEELEAGSATSMARGAPLTDDAPPLIEQIVEEYTRVGTAAKRGTLTDYPPAVRLPTQQITGILNGKVKSVRFETDIDDVEIYVPAETAPSAIKAGDVVAVSYGAVRGRVETLSRHGGLRFTLFDLLTNRAITCYMQPGHEEIMRDSWGKLVSVEGLVRRDPFSGQPSTIRQVTRIEPIPEGEPGAWRKAIGSIPHRDGALSAEEAVRRGRDA